jgi:multidrug resistance efflux pump
VLLMIFLAVVAATWTAFTEADLVVRASGRVRPATPRGMAADDVSDQISCEVGGRVVEVCVDEGDEICKGDVLLRLDTQHVDNQIAALEQTIRAEQEEFDKLGHLEKLKARQHEASQKKLQAELAEAEEEVRLAKQCQVRDVQMAKLELSEAQDREARARKLAASGAVTEQTLLEAVTRLGRAKETLLKAEIPIEEGALETLRRSLDLSVKQWEVQRKDSEITRRLKQGVLEADLLKLANLRLQRDQAVVSALADGVVTTVDVKAGDILEPGKVGLTTARQRGLEFEVTVPNPDMADLRAGLPAKIKLDAYDYQTYGTLNGNVVFVSPDSEVVDGPGGQQSAVYTVHIDLSEETLRRGVHRGQVKLGMTGKAEIVTDRESILMLLAKKIRQSISLG